MPPIDSLLLLACFAVVPIVMIALLSYRLVAWVRDRRAVAAMHASGWTPIGEDEPALREALVALRLEAPRARFFDRARMGEGADAVLVVTRRVPRGGGTDPALGGGSSTTYVIGRRDGEAPIGVVARRTGGMLEATAVGVADALGATSVAAPGWEWAIVSGPSAASAWTAAAGAALEAQVGPGERVHLGAGHLAIAADGRPISDRMRDARERLDALRAALSR